MLNSLLERLFPRGSSNSREEVKRRLKFVLAHDRADLSPETVEAMRQEILEVLSRYVDIDTEDSEFSLESSRQATTLIANLPIRRIKPVPTDGENLEDESENLKSPDNMEENLENPDHTESNPSDDSGTESYQI